MRGWGTKRGRGARGLANGAGKRPRQEQQCKQSTPAGTCRSYPSDVALGPGRFAGMAFFDRGRRNRARNQQRESLGAALGGGRLPGSDEADVHTFGLLDLATRRVGGLAILCMKGWPPREPGTPPWGGGACAHAIRGRRRPARDLKKYVFGDAIGTTSPGLRHPDRSLC